MQLIRSVAAIQQTAQGWKSQAVCIGLVPTMGFLHEGHLSLVRRARQCVGPRGKVVVSIYVNPIQFGPQEDLSRYPRDLPRDLRLCRQAGVDVVFAPGDRQMYPADGGQAMSTYVVEERLSRGMEGAARPTHFRGVATVVAKLFNLVLPDLAVFGAKDFQQAVVVRRLARDLNFPVKIVVAPTQRETDGLAMSSRNQYLSASERAEAVVLFQALRQAQRIVRRTPGGVPAGRLRRQLIRTIGAHPAARVDYAEFFDPATLRPVKRVTRGHRLALAVFLGRTRLIDNAAL